MSKGRSRNVKSVLAAARGKEKSYDWTEAAKLYEQAVNAVGKGEFLRKGEIQERIGRCFCRAAFQAETRDEFRKRMGLSVDAYEGVARLSEKAEDCKKQARISFCLGMAAYNKSWLAEESAERKALLDECHKLETKALQIYEETGDRAGYGKTCNELLACLFDRGWFAENFQELKNIAEEAMEYGEKLIEALSDVRDEYELARAHYMLATSLWMGPNIYESAEKQKEIMQKSLTYAQKALDISKKTGDAYLIGMSNWLIGWIVMELKGDFDSSLKYTKKGLELGTRIRDNLLMARARASLAYVGWWKMDVEEDPDKRRRGYNEAIQYSEEAMTHYLRFSYPLEGIVYVPRQECYWALAFFETDLKEKRVLLEKAVEVGRKDLEQAKRSGLPAATSYVLHSLSKALYSLSTMETKVSEKRRLLEEASKYREETISMFERLYPFSYWNRGLMFSYLALIRAELAKIETNTQERIGLVRKAVVDMEDCLKFCQKTVEARPQTRFFSSIGGYQDWFGGILNQLYSLTGEKKHLEKAIGVYEGAVQAWGAADYTAVRLRLAGRWLSSTTTWASIPRQHASLNLQPKDTDLQLRRFHSSKRSTQTTQHTCKRGAKSRQPGTTMGRGSMARQRSTTRRLLASINQ